MKNNQKLNLGCGEDYKGDYINVDIRDNVRVDYKLDLNKLPYPFQDNTFDEILMNCIIEHLDNPIEILKELWRISKDGCKIIIMTAHVNNYSAFGDLQHKYYFNEITFSEECMKEYELEDKMFLFDMRYEFTSKYKKFIPFKKYLKIYFNGMYDRICYELMVTKEYQNEK